MPPYWWYERYPQYPLAVAFYLWHGLASSTRTTYNVGQQFFIRYAKYHHLYNSDGSLLPASQAAIMGWVSSLAGHVQPRTIKQYLGHVKSMHTDLDLPFHACTAPIVQRLIRRIKHYHSERDTKQKLPITLPILRSLLQQLQPDTNSGHLEVYTACCVAFAGFLRCGEFTTQKGKSFSAATSPTRRSVEFFPDIENPTHTRLNLPASKTDPFRKGVSIYLAAAPGAPSCPIAALKKLFTNNHPADLDGPLFRNPDGSPLTRKFFIETVCCALQSTGHDSKEFSGHSFRQGTASSAAAAGCQDHKIQLLGRWLSDAYKIYIDIDQNRLHFLSTSLHWVLPHHLTFEPPALHLAS